MTPQQANLQKAIDQAYMDCNHIRAYEISTGILEEVEFGNAEGFASGLSSAHFMIYGEHYLTTVEPCDEDNYQRWLDPQ